MAFAAKPKSTPWQRLCQKRDHRATRSEPKRGSVGSPCVSLNQRRMKSEPKRGSVGSPWVSLNQRRMKSEPKRGSVGSPCVSLNQRRMKSEPKRGSVGSPWVSLNQRRMKSEPNRGSVGSLDCRLPILDFRLLHSLAANQKSKIENRQWNDPTLPRFGSDFIRRWLSVMREQARYGADVIPQGFRVLDAATQRMDSPRLCTKRLQKLRACRD